MVDTVLLRRAPLLRRPGTGDAAATVINGGGGSRSERSTALALAAGVCAAVASVATKLALDGAALPCMWPQVTLWQPMVRGYT